MQQKDEILDVRVEGFTGLQRYADVGRLELISAVAQGMQQLEKQQGGRLNFAKFPVKGKDPINIQAEDLLPHSDHPGFLSNTGILRELSLGNITIFPFKPENLGRDSYDVTLGENYWVMVPDHLKRKNLPPEIPIVGEFMYLLYILRLGKEQTVFNPYSAVEAKRLWEGPNKAIKAGELSKRINARPFDGINVEEKVLYAPPGFMLLAHTDEFIGTGGFISFISARSSIGRNFWTVCEDSFLIHRDFKNRVTLEIKSKIPDSQRINNILLVGQSIAQIVFLAGELPLVGSNNVQAKYSSPGLDLGAVIQNWNPNMMLPKLYSERAIQNG